MENDSELFVPFGPIDDPMIKDDFTFSDVKGSECVAVACKNISAVLNARAAENGSTYLTICVPCYNEELEEFYKTILSLMENVEFMKKQVRLHDDFAGEK